MYRSASGVCFVHSCLELLRAQVLRFMRVILTNDWRKNHVEESNQQWCVVCIQAVRYREA